MPSPAGSSTASSLTSNGSASPETSSFPFTDAPQHNALKQLSSVLTRHLGTLTSTISGYADLLVDAQDDQDQREIAMNLLDASTRIDDLLADLRHYSRSLDPAPRTVPIPEIVEGTVHLLEEDEQDHVCQRVEPPAVREIEADPRLLRQALLNLLKNALDARSDAEDVLFRATLNEDEQTNTDVAFEVWNDGEISAEDPAELFQPFYTTRPQRLGLGLPIATHIAAQHDGIVQLATNSAEDGGTCFTLRI